MHAAGSDEEQRPERAKRLTFGPRRWAAALFAVLFFALAVYLGVTGRSIPLAVAALIVAGLLALRASGLQRAVGEITPAEGHLRIETDFDLSDDDADA